MIRVQKDNVQYRIPDDALKDYENMGFKKVIVPEGKKKQKQTNNEQGSGE